LRRVRGIRWAAALAVGALALSACGNKGDDNNDNGGGKSSVKVGMAYDVGGRGDKSFNDSAASGLDKAKSQLKVQAQEVSPNQQATDRSERLKQLVEGSFNPVIGVGFAWSNDLDTIAKANPKTYFAIVDDSSHPEPNVANLVFTEEQGSYIVGVAAALKSKTKHVGFIGGVKSDLIAKFEAGYVAGVHSVDPNIKVDITYLTTPPDFGGFNAPDKAKVAAQGMYDNGADVIYHAAGKSGPGLFDAAVDTRKAGKEVWAIGVDSDQYQTATPDQQKVILTSMMKRVDVAVYDYIKSYVDKKPLTGEQRYSLKDGGISYATSGGYVDDIKDKLEKAKQDIIDGKITVPAKPTGS
jgi:basic membrane protein A